MQIKTRAHRLVYYSVVSAIVLGLYLSSLYSYLLFHSLVEITTITISFTLFIIVWNAGKFLANDCLRFLGIGYAFIAVLDLLHTLAYKGMNVFPGYNANLPTQLWIAARYLQAITLCTAPIFIKRRISEPTIFGIFFATVTTTIALVYSGNFPDCFIEGHGLTLFKISSEYVITAMLLSALILFHRNRAQFSSKVSHLVLASIICTAGAELSFTAYVSVYGFANLTGHFFKLAAFYLIYRALLVTGIKEPYELIFRDLKQKEEQLIDVNSKLETEIIEHEMAEEELRKSRDELEERVIERTAQLSQSNEQLKFELIERQQAQESLQEQAALLEEEIEERQRVEEERSYLAAIVESSDDAIIGKSLDGIIETWNRGAESLYGYREDEVKGQSIALLLPADRTEELIHILGHVRQGTPLDHYETVRVHKDGRLINVSLTVSPIHDADGRIVGASTIARNITARKKAESELRQLYEELELRVNERTAELYASSKELADSQQALLNIVDDLNQKTEELEQANTKLKEMDRLKSLFIASMSHELRTPLNSIIGFSSILHDEWAGPVNVKQKENLAIILRSGNHLLNLINDVIDVSKIEAGRIEFDAEEFDLHDLIDEAVTLIKKEIETKGLALQVELLHQTMHTDRRRLLQCLLNLLSNAVKFTPQGGINVTTSIVSGVIDRKDALFAEICVEDTGLGISETDIKRMFQPFVRLVSPLQATIPGTGLGLYLTRKLVVEILKGDLLLTSELGKGSKFTLRVPVRLS